jgi:hypothetical protein
MKKIERESERLKNGSLIKDKHIDNVFLVFCSSI